MPVQRITPAAAEADQRRVAGWLLQQGLSSGDRLGLVATGSAAMLAAIGGALRRGIVPVPINPALLAHEQAALLGDADCAVVLRDADLPAVLDAPQAELAPAPLARPMHFTSGTTGTPKGVWSGVLDESAAAGLLAEERALWGFHAGDVHLVCSPLHHSAPIRFALGTLLAGGEVLLPGPFEPASVAAAIAEHRPTTTFLVPAHLQRLHGLDRPLDLASFRLVAHAGSPCPEYLKLSALESFPEGTVWEFYGSTEGQFTACPPEDWLAKPGSVGRARPGRTLTVDDEGGIWCQVPPFARFEYWRDPEKTAAAWRGDSFTAGDVGRLDDDGYLFLDGRRDDLIISGGVNVYPAEVEHALFELDGVDDVAVFGVADERWGDRVCAAVVGSVTAAEVDAAAQASLAPYKRPKQVVVVDEIPRNSMGKVQRSTLGETLGLT